MQGSFDSNSTIVKRPRMPSGGRDRLSDLPDELLSIIISFLNPKEAGQTSTLSKRWNNVWKTYKHLEFVAKEDEIRRFSTGALSFVQRVNYMLKVHQGEITRLKVSYPYNEVLQKELEAWVVFATSRGIEHLELDFTPSYFCMMPFPNLGALFRAGFKSLKTLKLSAVLVSGQLFHGFLQEFPCLETLAINFSCSPELEEVVVCGPLALKQLLITSCLYLRSVTVKNSNLEALILSPVKELTIDESPLLKDVRSGGWAVVASLSTTSLMNLETLGVTLSNVEVSEFGRMVSLPAVLLSLKTLILNVEAWSNHSMLELTSMFQYCPNLETLIIEMNWLYWVPTPRQTLVLSDSLNIQNLKTLEIRGYWGRIADDELISAILSNAQNLRSLVVDCRCLDRIHPVRRRYCSVWADEIEQNARIHAEALRGLVTGETELTILF